MFVRGVGGVCEVSVNWRHGFSPRYVNQIDRAELDEGFTGYSVHFVLCREHRLDLESGK